MSHHQVCSNNECPFFKLIELKGKNPTMEKNYLLSYINMK